MWRKEREKNIPMKGRLILRLMSLRRAGECVWASTSELGWKAIGAVSEC